MLRKTSFLLAAALLAGACSGNKKKTETPKVDQSPTTDNSAGANDSGEKTEVAQGEMREILLALKRVHFSLDSDTLTQDSRDALTEAGEKLKKHPEVALSVDGHADQRGTEEYNVALGERRARQVADFLTRLGVASDRLKVVSYGEEQPLVEGDSAAAMAANRRVDFKLMRGDVRLVLEDSPLLDDQGNPIAGQK